MPRIKFHGLRHTCATMLLSAGEPIHVVSARLGHATVTMTLSIYAHVLKDSQEKAARTMGRRSTANGRLTGASARTVRGFWREARNGPILRA